MWNDQGNNSRTVYDRKFLKIWIFKAVSEVKKFAPLRVLDLSWHKQLYQGSFNDAFPEIFIIALARGVWWSLISFSQMEHYFFYTNIKMFHKRNLQIPLNNSFSYTYSNRLRYLRTILLELFWIFFVFFTASCILLAVSFVCTLNVSGALRNFALRWIFFSIFSSSSVENAFGSWRSI